MQRIDRIHREALKQTLFHHFARAAQILLGGLKDKVHRAAKATRGRQLQRCRQQYRGMAVVAAGVHHALTRRAPLRVAFFGDGQGVHIGAQSDNRAVAVAQRADHASACQPAMHL